MAVDPEASLALHRVKTPVRSNVLLGVICPELGNHTRQMVLIGKAFNHV